MQPGYAVSARAVSASLGGVTSRDITVTMCPFLLRDEITQCGLPGATGGLQIGHTEAMPDIPVGTQIFDLVFHPTDSIVFAGLLTGHVRAFSYDEQGTYDDRFALRPSKRSCRALAISEDGSKLWAAGKAKTL